MADILISPLLPFASISWMLQNTSRGGGASSSGSEQVVQSPTGRWVATATFNVFTGQENPSVLLYRSLIRRGRAAGILLPEMDTRGPMQFANLDIPGRGLPYSDDAFHSDTTGFDQTTGATLIEDADLNATLVKINLELGLVLTPGMRFSTPDYRMHEIDEIVQFNRLTGNWTVRIAPWLRAAYAAGTVLNFDTPTCRMRLASDSTGQLTVASRALATPSIDFVEYF